MHSSGKGDGGITYMNFDLNYIFRGDKEHAFSEKDLVQQWHMDKERCAREKNDKEDGKEGQGVGFVRPNSP
jgi:hypothetical protein